jgi:ABC-type siderophore export system fused ATPase/permease subunit
LVWENPIESQGNPVKRYSLIISMITKKAMADRRLSFLKKAKGRKKRLKKI